MRGDILLHMPAAVRAGTSCCAGPRIKRAPVPGASLPVSNLSCYHPLLLQVALALVLARCLTLPAYHRYPHSTQLTGPRQAWASLQPQLPPPASGTMGDPGIAILPLPFQHPSMLPYNPAATLPPNVVKRILALEFVEMSELRGDIWSGLNSN